MSSSSAVATGLPIQAEAIPVQRASTPDSRNTQVLAVSRLCTLHVSTDIFLWPSVKTFELLGTAASCSYKRESWSLPGYI